MKRLSNLDPAEVSLVGKAANKKKFLIFKSRKGNEMARNQEILNMVNAVDAKTMNNIEKILKNMPAATPAKKDASGDMLPKKDSAVYKDDEEAGAPGHHEGAPLSDRAQAAMKAAARILAPHKDEIHGGHMDAIQHEIGIGSGPKEAGVGDEDPGDKAGGMMAIPEEVEETHHAEALDMAKKAYKSHLEKMGYRKYPDQQPTQKAGKKPMEEDDEDDGGEDVSKVKKSDDTLDLSAFPVNQRAQLELIFKSNQELVQKNVSLEKDLKHERDLRIMGEFKEKVSGLKHLGADSDELATVLKSLTEKDPESAAKIERVLKAADAQIGMGGDLFGERGTRISKSAAGSPAAKLDALVDSVVQKSDGNKTREMIYDEVIQTPEGKRLYKEFKSSRPHGS